jgi:hypothetical protein
VNLHHQIILSGTGRPNVIGRVEQNVTIYSGNSHLSFPLERGST